MDDFRFPDEVPNLDAVPLDCHEMYEPAGDGYALKAEERPGRDEFLATIDKMAKEHAENMAAAEARTAAQHERIKQLLVDRDLREALDATDIVRPKFWPAAYALIKQQRGLTFEIDWSTRDENGVPGLIANDEFGPTAIASVVSRWLDSDDARPFRAGAPKPGPFAQMIAEMSAPR